MKVLIALIALLPMLAFASEGPDNEGAWQVVCNPETGSNRKCHLANHPMTGNGAILTEVDARQFWDIHARDAHPLFGTIKIQFTCKIHQKVGLDRESGDVRVRTWLRDIRLADEPGTSSGRHSHAKRQLCKLLAPTLRDYNHTTEHDNTWSHCSDDHGYKASRERDMQTADDGRATTLWHLDIEHDRQYSAMRMSGIVRVEFGINDTRSFSHQYREFLSRCGEGDADFGPTYLALPAAPP